jgi:hypothetical protein
MSISSETRTAGPYVSTGTTGPYNFAFKVFQTSDVQVVKTDLSGVETVQTLTTDYTVSLNADQNANPGGSITSTLSGTLPAGYLMTLTSAVGNLQPTALTNNGGFFPNVINDALDRATILVQQLLNKVNRSIKIPLSDGALTTQLPTATLRANKAIVFDNSGNVTVSVDDYVDQEATVAASAAAAAAAAAQCTAALASATSWHKLTASGNLLINADNLMNGASLVVGTLPAGPTDGQVCRVTGIGVGGWKIAQGNTDHIIFGNVATTAGSGGYLQSTNQYDFVHLKYSSDAAAWIVQYSVGNITYV